MDDLTPLQRWQRNAERVLDSTRGEPKTLSECEYPSYVRKPTFYDPEKLKRYQAEQARQRADRAAAMAPPMATGANRIYIGERGGRYYKRRRADGTTYREYTW